ncbi:MAG: hypothetical protein HZB33_10605, partial [Nitrospirae bacterium]|nr:hypothetical protein [Nitrospirota bacterium]
MTEHIELDRRFWPADIDEENSTESMRTMAALGIDQQIFWDDLLKKPRVVIIAEPGTGKTEELRSSAKRLRNDGKFSFFCRIELLQDLDIRHTFDIGTSAEFKEWLSGDQEGYFFLDSIDEALLRNRSAFEIALRRFSDAIGDAFNRAKIIVSCRVSVWRATADLLLFST